MELSIATSVLTTEISIDSAVPAEFEFESKTFFFAWPLFVSLQQTAENVAFSPWSVQAGMTLLSMASTNRTQKQLNYWSAANVNNILTVMLGYDSCFHNSVMLFTSDRNLLREEFQNLLQLCKFQWELVNMDPSGEESYINVSKWIPTAAVPLSEAAASGEVCLSRNAFLLCQCVQIHNALWKQAFQPLASTQLQLGMFHVMSSLSVSVPMMHWIGDTHYVHCNQLHCSVVILPLLLQGESSSSSSDSSCVVLVLPDRCTSLCKLALSLRDSVLMELIDKAKVEHVHLILPRFSMQGNYNFTENLQHLGAMDMFHEGRAALPGVSASVAMHLKAWLQSVRVSVDEFGLNVDPTHECRRQVVEGCRLSAECCTVERNAANITVNQPFLFVWCDLKEKAVLLLARIRNPLSQ